MNKNYDMLISGCGFAGLMAVRSSRQLDLTLALAEKDRLGGDCTWTGCVPGKPLLRAAKSAQNINDAAGFGITSSRPTMGFRSGRGR
ncbi:MAG: pyridine nucleotide-disulfide oxidoreductase, partial [Dehalococcoidia bacterium]|nr:pyridine nucleotide-disulfide oxidoreductase [Dehalococcoidia bacterium]